MREVLRYDVQSYLNFPDTHIVYTELPLKGHKLRLLKIFWHDLSQELILIMHFESASVGTEGHDRRILITLFLEHEHQALRKWARSERWIDLHSPPSEE